MSIQAVAWAGCLTVLSLSVSGCVSSNQGTPSAVASAPPWVQNLNEPPPSHEAASDEAARLRADLRGG